MAQLPGEDTPGAGRGRWDDLIVRMASGGTLAVIGLAAMWAGGLWFHGFVALAVGLMIWELARMLGGARGAAVIPGVLAGAAMMIAPELPDGFALPLVLAPALYRDERMRGHRTQFAIFTVAVCVAGFGLIELRDDFGFVWMGWLALVVIATDVGGYFGGRAMGGPKIWPRVSPKKTWSGTIAGWVCAALISIPFITEEGAAIEILGFAMAASMASQLGDVSESALKRRVDRKDSSSLIPGHGGLLDRFDSMLGASLFLLLIGQISGFPPAPV